MNTAPIQDETDLLALLDRVLGHNETSVLADYLSKVANEHLITLKSDEYLQYGNKDGQSLYTHVLGGIFVLAQLCNLFQLPDLEVRLLFATYTVHDINKLLERSQGMNKDAVPASIAGQIVRFGLDIFFPQYESYIEDITTLARGHGGHSPVHGESLIVRNSSRYGLGRERVLQLLHLIKAIDILDLSHTLDEQTHKTTFLSDLNAFALTKDVQYTFFIHRLDESRGGLTNILHNTICEELQTHYNLLPLLLYPDGIAYLVRRGQEPQISSAAIKGMATRAAGNIADLTGVKFEEFIEVRPLGIKVDAKCLMLGHPFDRIWNRIDAIVQRRNFKHEELAQKAITRARADFAKNAARYPHVAPKVEILLTTNPIATSDPRLRIGELIRSYFIFLGDHFAKPIPQPWERIYNLLEVPAEQRQVLAFFDARMDRAYVLARDLPLSEEIVSKRLLEDGRPLLANNANDDPRIPMLTRYLEHHALFGSQGRTIAATSGPQQYVSHQHQQCVQCSDDFPTTPWMSADVRSDIAVQTFSNRLRGGPGEPKKNVCVICQAQYLIEKLSYPEINKERTVYIHLYPYAFFTRPFIQGLQKVLNTLKREDSRALWLDGDRAMLRYTTERRITAPMLTQTKAGKPHTFGVYMPNYAEAMIGNLLILPLNPAGDTDTDRFLFALEYALILQRYFGCRVVLSTSPVVSFSQEYVGDLTTDMTPLSCRGLIAATTYRQFPSTGQADLKVLWTQIQHLYTIKRWTSVGKDDPLPELVEALAFHPLGIFYTTEKLIEGRARDARNTEWMLIHLSHEVFNAVEQLAHSKGVSFMEHLSTYLSHLAQIAWESRLRGRTREKSSLVMPLDNVLDKLNRRSKEQDVETLKAACVEDIHEYLNRVAPARYRTGPRPKRWEDIKSFVDIFFDRILADVYGNSITKLLNDEKLLRSAFLFYVREQIPVRAAEVPEDEEDLDHSSNGDA